MFHLRCPYVTTHLHVGDCIHDLTAQYHFCAQNMEITESMLSYYAREGWSKITAKSIYKGSLNNMVLSLRDKSNCVILYIAPNQCINNGLPVTTLTVTLTIMPT